MLCIDLEVQILGVKYTTPLAVLGKKQLKIAFFVGYKRRLSSIPPAPSLTKLMDGARKVFSIIFIKKGRC